MLYSSRRAAVSAFVGGPPVRPLHKSVRLTVPVMLAFGLLICLLAEIGFKIGEANMFMLWVILSNNQCMTKVVVITNLLII